MEKEERQRELQEKHSASVNTMEKQVINVYLYLMIKTCVLF